MLVRRTFALFLLVLATVVSATIAADVPAKDEKSRRRAMLQEVDRSAVAFAREHHPELADLLDGLRRSNPRAYRAAIQDVSKERTRLERLKDRAPERYEFELKLWTMNSRIRLLAARAARGDAEALRPQLQQLMQERQDFRLQQLRREQERLTTRLSRVASEIERVESRPPTDADVEALLTRARSKMSAFKSQQAEVPVTPAEPNTESEPSAPTESPQD